MERVSELMDGELNVDAAEREVSVLKSNAAARECWDTFHLIGDAMRGNASAMPDFASRFGARLASEPTVLAPRVRLPRHWRAYAMSAAASLAAVSVVAWMGMGVMRAETPAKVMVNAPVPASVVVQSVAAPIAATAPAPQLIPAAALDVHEYMLAHQGISPTTAIQGVTTYIRTVAGSEE
jgi:sigma-E factor negative regulatory protein RseA